MTLIELLLCSGIIGLLAAIALANLSEARTRSKLARVRSDMRTIAGALEAYAADQGNYPPAAVGDVLLASPLEVLRAPVAYLGAVPRDPFGPAPFAFAPELWMDSYSYKDAATTSRGIPGETYGSMWQRMPEKKYMLHSPGPNCRWDVVPYVEYDPTNGTVSNGDVTRFGPME